MNGPEIHISFAPDLGLFVAADRRSGRTPVTTDGASSLGHVVESLGVPLTEAGRLRGAVVYVVGIRPEVAMATVLVGLYAIHRILGVTERAMAGRRVVLAALLEQMREQMPQPLRAITTGRAVRDLVYFPFSVGGRVLPERGRARRGGGAG